MQLCCMNLFSLFLDKLEKEELFTQREIRFVNCSEILKQELSKTTLSKYCKKFNVNKGTLHYMIHGKRAIYFDLVSIEKINNEKTRVLLKNATIPIKIPETLTQELAYLIGMLRDGSVMKEKNDEYTCVFYSKYSDALNIIREYLKKVFDVQSTIENNKEDLFQVRVRSKTLYYFLKVMFETKEKQVDWKTPDLIKQSNALIKKWYVRGFWDAEGGCPHNVNKKKKDLEVKFSQKNKESLEFIKQFLNSINIKTGNVYWNKDTFVLKITQSHIPQFQMVICSSHPVKAKRLEEVAKVFVH